MSKQNQKTEVPSARQLLSALGEHVNQLRPSVNPKPRNKQISAARATATVINSSMTVVKTAMQATKLAGAKPVVAFLQLEEN